MQTSQVMGIFVILLLTYLVILTIALGAMSMGSLVPVTIIATVVFSIFLIAAFFGSNKVEHDIEEDAEDEERQERAVRDRDAAL